MWYGLAWASFGALHSVLAADSVKTALGLGRYTRLGYNGFAVLYLGGIWWLGKFWLSDAAPLGLTPAVEMISNGVSVLGLVVITWACRAMTEADFSEPSFARRRPPMTKTCPSLVFIDLYVTRCIADCSWCFGGMPRRN